MANIEVNNFVHRLQNIVDDIADWNKRTERSAVPPQKPVVQSACNELTRPEQSAGVVQDGMEPSDRKALSVQSAAMIAKLIQCGTRVVNRHTDGRLAAPGDSTSIDRLREAIEEASKFLQVEHEAKLAAAD